MKVELHGATAIAPHSIKYFYIYEISCDGTIIPFNPKYLISYLLNDKLLLQSYSGDVYRTVEGTYGSLKAGLNSEEIIFTLRLEVSTIRMSISELIDVIYSNYKYDTVEKVKKLILLAACSKAMLISLLYLIFYNLIDINDLEKLANLNYDDLYDFVLNILKENCLVKNPLEVNFQAYIDEASNGACEFTDPDDVVIDYDQSLDIVVNTGGYKNVAKLVGGSVSYRREDICDENKLTNNTTEWDHELDSDVANGYISYDKENGEFEFLSNINDTACLHLSGSVLKNVSKHVTITIPKDTPLYRPTEPDVKFVREVTLYPGDSINTISTSYVKYDARSYNYKFATGCTFRVQEYKRPWYYDMYNDILSYRFNIISGSEYNVSTETQRKYTMRLNANLDINSTNYRALTITNNRIKNNTSNLTFTIPVDTKISLDVGFGFKLDTQTKTALKIKPGETKEIYFYDPDFENTGYWGWWPYNFMQKSSMKVTMKHANLKITVESTENIPVNNGDIVTLNKAADVLVFGDSSEIEDNQATTIDGIAKVRTDDYKLDLYKIPMTVSGITGAENVSLRSEIASISNMISYTPTGGLKNTVDLISQSDNNDKKVFIPGVEDKTTIDVNNITAADLTDENTSKITVVPADVLIGKTESIGLTHKPRLIVKLDSDALFSRDTVNHMIDELITAETPVDVPEDQENYIMKVNKLKYKPKIVLNFYINNTTTDVIENTFEDIQFVLNYSDFELQLNGNTYTTENGHLTANITESTFAAIDAKYNGSVTYKNVSLRAFELGADTTARATLNKTELTKYLQSRPSTIKLIQVQLDTPDLLTAIDISDYNIYLYNGQFYKGLEGAI